MSGMGESPKVLQVTFGSFSCTLEGFEDPVQTLFAVAEHFRDLAARDPGFARGTLIPDAATLARQVEAAGGGSGAVRVAGEGWVDEAPAAPRLPRDEAEDDAAAEVADLVRVVAAVAESAGATLGDGARSGTGGLDIERLAAALAATRRGASRPEGEARVDDLRPVVTRVAPQAPASTAFHDWGADEEEDLLGAWRNAVAHDEAARAAEGDDDPADEEDDEDRPRIRPAHSAEEAGDARRLLSTPPDQDEAGLLRILSRAESQLADPGVTRRREAMAHLKAAVAATEAQRALDGDDVRPQDATASYREEWAAAARPLGVPVAARTERPAPPPLRLVASQRVDMTRNPEGEDGGRPEAAEPVDGRPAAEPILRPVPEPPARSEAPLAAVPPAPRPAATVAADTSFAAFAAQAGATGSLPDLLEAAASWLQVVRGEEEVSRLQLLSLVAEVLPEPPNREDALRVFGALLRQGRLARVEGGRFRVGASTRFGAARHAV